VFSLENDSCPSEQSGFIPGLSFAASLSVVVVVPIVLLALIGAVIVLAVPGLRRRVFPYQNRPFRRFAQPPR